MLSSTMPIKTKQKPVELMVWLFIISILRFSVYSMVEEEVMDKSVHLGRLYLYFLFAFGPKLLRLVKLIVVVFPFFFEIFVAGFFYT